MKISSFFSNGKVFAEFENVKGYAFRSALLRVNYTLLPVICAGFAHGQGTYAHLNSIECLPPHHSAA
ncbi:MAG: hypothetical protein VB099_18105 [Candidatus Limiplasma sp.]|nr:hypothetical protein [Candidatus Limiplasma sp.]